jgi:uncharacterized surface protein with fasciclin (FAS1) repeats
MKLVFFILTFFVTNNLIAKDNDFYNSIIENSRLTKLSEYLNASDLKEEILALEDITVFAPLDDAFAALSAKTYYGYLKEDNKNKLRNLLNFHFVEGKFYTENITDSIKKVSLNGLDIEIKNVNGILYFNGAEVVESDIPFRNGYIHLINRVLIPK